MKNISVIVFGKNNTVVIWEKHFGNTASVGLNHVNIESFFDELTQDCLREKADNDLLKPANQYWSEQADIA